METFFKVLTVLIILWAAVSLVWCVVLYFWFRRESREFDERRKKARERIDRRRRTSGRVV